MVFVGRNYFYYFNTLYVKIKLLILCNVKWNGKIKKITF